VVVGGGTGREVDDGGGMWQLASLMIKGQLISRFVRPRALMFMARIRKGDLTFLANLIQSGQLTSVVDRTYSLANAADAIRHVETGHARGKVIVTP
jgi:NADPH:quinone reductase-like Zn-dependent oxidoreductase